MKYNGSPSKGSTVLLSIFAAAIIGLNGAGQGHPVGYRWQLTAPDGQQFSLTQQNTSLSYDGGEWRIRLEVVYLHQSPIGPIPWVAVKSTVYPTPLFADGFESGDTTEWEE